MKLAHTLRVWRRERHPLYLAIGFFDGLHRGHARVIHAALKQARANGGAAWVLTFDPHPARILHPPAAPRLLTSLSHKLQLIAALDVDGCMVLPFTRALADLAPEDFGHRLRSAAPTLAHVFVGPNWRFGKGRAGTPALLRRYARTHGFGVTAVAPARRDGAVVSSTRIRTAVAAGDLATAARLLGRPYSVLGHVKQGQKLGRRLGYPTANLAPTNEQLPPWGIYAIRARLGSVLYDGVLSYGVRPTVHPGPHAPAVMEAHLFDFDGDLYGQEMEFSFIQKIRNERALPSLEALQAQIARDCESARKILRSMDKVRPPLAEQARPLSISNLRPQAVRRRWPDNCMAPPPEEATGDSHAQAIHRLQQKQA